jgi:hypothetical protein
MNMEARELKIVGFNGQSLQNVLEPSKPDNQHLAVFLPGIAYGMTFPAMYYPRMVLYSLGADELRIEPTYRLAGWKEISESQKTDCVIADAKAILEAINNLKQYGRVTFVGKSIATLVLAQIIEQRFSLESEFIWLTPLFKNNHFLETITTKNHRSIFFIGSSDQHYDPALIEQVSKASAGQVIVLEGANHSLEIAGDVFGSIQIQARIANQIKEFLM